MPLQHRIEFGALVELDLFDDFARESRDWKAAPGWSPPPGRRVAPLGGSPPGRRKRSRGYRSGARLGLLRGVIILTAASDATSASTVGTMIQLRLRVSAWPSACRSRSPDSESADDGLRSQRRRPGHRPLHHRLVFACTPERQPHRILPRTQLLVRPRTLPSTLHYGCRWVNSSHLAKLPRTGYWHSGHFLLTIEGLNRAATFFRIPVMRGPTPLPIPCLVRSASCSTGAHWF